MTTNDYTFGPTGQVVYDRTYSRKKPDGTSEIWPETVERVVHGNLALIYGDDRAAWSDETRAEERALLEHIRTFKLLPAGRHLWASGVKGRQYLMNCWTSGWGENFSDHFEFTFMRLMEGGGVGANYSSKYLYDYGLPNRRLNVHIVADQDHPDHDELAELLSDEYTSDWEGAFEVEDSREGWAAALVDLIDTFFTKDAVKHQNRVYDVTNVRPKGARLKTFGGTASGPAPFARMMHEVARVLNKAHDRWNMSHCAHPDADRFHITPIEAMEIDHAIAECVVSGGVRRSARMAMVHWNDPYIDQFIACKADTGKHWTTNISVEIDEEFINYIQAEVRRIEWAEPRDTAYRVYDSAIRSMLANGEPGFFNSTLANQGEVGEIYTTNPCGEITLEPWEACNLGHVNLDAFADSTFEELAYAHELMTRFLIRATFADVPDPKSREILDKNRRIGVGHFGVQGFLAKNGIRYSDASRNDWFKVRLSNFQDIVDGAAVEYVFKLRIPTPVKTTTVAPTGTIAKMPGATEGIHPVYARHFIRRIRFNHTDPEQSEQLNILFDQGFKLEADIYDQSGNTIVVEIPTKELLVEQVEEMGYAGSIVESADEISLADMLAFQKMYQDHWANNAVSFTVNFPEGDLSAGQAARTIAEYLPYLKGTTLMPDGTREQAPYERITEAEYEASLIQAVADSIDEECAQGVCPVR